MKSLLQSGYFLILLSAFGLSFKSILAKFAYDYGVDAATLIILRVCLGLPMIIGALFWLEGAAGFRLKRNEAVPVAALGVMGGLAMMLSFVSIHRIDAALSTLVTFIYPALTTALLALVFRRKPTARIYVSLIVAFAGLSLIVRIDRAEFVAVNADGVFMALGAALAFAVYNVLSERLIANVSPVKVIAWATPTTLLFLLLMPGERAWPSSWQVWLIAVLLAGVSGFIPFLAYIYAIKKIGAAKATIASSIGPIFTVIWARTFLGESLDGVQIAGMFLIIAGVIALKARIPFADYFRR